jgi:hypothetical protein
MRTSQVRQHGAALLRPGYIQVCELARMIDEAHEDIISRPRRSVMTGKEPALIGRSQISSTPGSPSELAPKQNVPR